MIFNKIKKKSAAVSMIVVLIAGVVFIPAAGYAFTNIARTAEKEGDKVKDSMPYQVLGTDYERPIEYTEGYEEVNLDELVVPAPTLTSNSYEVRNLSYKSGLTESVNPHVFTAPEGASLNIKMNYRFEGNAPVDMAVVPGMANSIYLHTVGVYTLQIEAISVMHFNVNGQTVTKYSNPTIKTIRINVNPSAEFSMYGYTVLPDYSVIPIEQTIQLRMIMSENIRTVSDIYMSINGGTYSRITDYGRYASGDTGIVFLNLTDQLPLRRYLDLVSPVANVKFKVLIISDDGDVSYPEVPVRISR